MVSTWPMPVARAAPRIPSFGKKPIPQIRNGSRMMLLIHPTSRASMDTFIRPTAWKSFSKKRLMAITVENRKTMVEYSSPIRITVSSCVYIRSNAVITAILITVIRIPWITDRRKPWVAAVSAIFLSPAPR